MGEVSKIHKNKGVENYQNNQRKTQVKRETAVSKAHHYALFPHLLVQLDL